MRSSKSGRQTTEVADGGIVFRGVRGRPGVSPRILQDRDRDGQHHVQLADHEPAAAADRCAYRRKNRRHKSMRSFLFVPGDSLRKFESAKKTAADALILDLEDSIAPEEKVGARRTVREMLDARNPNQRNYIRVNALDTDMTLGDLAA